MNRIAMCIIGLLIAALGFFCLNYTQGFGIDHHAEWAASHGMPAPSPVIFDVGVVLLALGGGAIGFGLGRRRK